MNLKSDHVMQFKVTLTGIRPPIWRRILVPCDYSFWDLHVAIQDAMGWMDCHLHQFEVTIPLTTETVLVGIPLEEDMLDGDSVAPGWNLPIAALFTLFNRKASYEYDFGDSWRHAVVLEKIRPREKNEVCPVCIGGKRACPPEDCGGVWGYQNLLAAIADPTDEDHEEMMQWVGGSFDPEHFTKDAVVFTDPSKRWDMAFRHRPTI